MTISQRMDDGYSLGLWFTSHEQRADQPDPSGADTFRRELTDDTCHQGQAAGTKPEAGEYSA
ncbi:MAG: hypothetical protein VX228_12040, partial [Pseudomonadota bacterium]|nr:hypothetical protein [Pseudomonadota bacterium]